MELLDFPSITDIEQMTIKTLLNKMVRIAITEDISSHAKVIWSFSPTLLRISNTRFFK